FTAVDLAGNQSPAADVAIVYDDVPPPAVETLTLDDRGDGVSMILDWSGYDESAHGDVAAYRIYKEEVAFTDLTGLNPAAEVIAGTFTYTIHNLERGVAFWFAVAAVDAAGNVANTVDAIPGTPVDATPPEDPEDLTVQSFEDRLIFNWSPSADSDGDLAGYKVYFNNDETGVSIPADPNSYEAAGLNPASEYPVRITAVDNDGNESPGAL
ncbi:MAG: fibronectin type III domain-containing protein, partial [FCB group bacterium]|nr:fibronectin type III domain-containing protein [FCB group bacterium]